MPHAIDAATQRRPALRSSLAARGRVFLLTWFLPLRGLFSGHVHRLQSKKRTDTASPSGESPGVGEPEFASARDFRDLFRMLEAKRVLWGSQKQYTASELKILINRVRTHNPALRLPLEVIPETRGLRQRVQELAAAAAGNAAWRS